MKARELVEIQFENMEKEDAWRDLEEEIQKDQLDYFNKVCLEEAETVQKKIDQLNENQKEMFARQKAELEEVKARHKAELDKSNEDNADLINEANELKSALLTRQQVYFATDPVYSKKISDYRRLKDEWVNHSPLLAEAIYKYKKARKK